MKKLLLLIIISGLMVSCGPGRWVGGNAKNFQQRHDAKVKKKAAKQLREAKSEFDNTKPKN